MNIIAVDDETLARGALVRSLKEVFPGAQIRDFSKPSQALEYVLEAGSRDGEVEYAFLDIQMRGMTGIELARQLKEINPLITILFVTGYNNYAAEAFGVMAKGYILKPVNKEAIESALMSLIQKERKEPEKKEKKLKAVTFGTFDIYCNGETIIFERRKAKELLAFLIDKKGAGVTNAEIEASLWEDAEVDMRKNSSVQKIISAMMKALKQVGAEDTIIKKHNYLAIRPDAVDCDYYRFLAGDIGSINEYRGAYMTEFPWAEMTTASLTEQKLTKYD